MKPGSEVPFLDGMDFGKGIDTLQLIPRGIAVNDANGSQPQPVLGGAADTIVFEIARVDSYEDLQSALNLDASVTAVMGLFGGNAAFRFAERQKFHSFSQYLVASIVITKAFMEIPRPQLDSKTDAADLLSNGDNQRFAEEFGDMFVLGARMGGAYYAVLEFTAKSEEDVTNVKASLDAGEFGVFATSDSFSRSISNFKGNASLRVKSFQTGGTNEGQETNIDAIITKAKNFATELGDRGSPFVALLQDYKSLRLPKPPNFVDIQAAADVLTNYANLRSDIVTKINNIEYIQLNPDQFVDAASFDLQGMLDKLTDALNQLKANASTCVNAVKACKFANVAIPPVVLPKRISGAAPSIDGIWRPDPDDKDFDISQLAITSTGIGQANVVVTFRHGQNAPIVKSTTATLDAGTNTYRSPVITKQIFGPLHRRDLHKVSFSNAIVGNKTTVTQTVVEPGKPDVNLVSPFARQA